MRERRKHSIMRNITALLAILSGILLYSMAQNDCATETATLVANTLVQGAFQDLQTAIVSDLNNNLQQVCSIENLGCSVDFSGYSSTFTTVCQTANGTVMTRNVSIGCTGSFNDVTIPVDFQLDLQNIPACVGVSCDNATSIPEEIQSNVENTRIQVADTIETLTGGALQCRGDVSPETSPSPIMTLSPAPTEQAAPPMAAPILLTPSPSVISEDDTATSAPVVAPVAPIAAPVSPESLTSSSAMALGKTMPLLVLAAVTLLVVWV